MIRKVFNDFLSSGGCKEDAQQIVKPGNATENYRQIKLEEAKDFISVANLVLGVRSSRDAILLTPSPNKRTQC